MPKKSTLTEYSTRVDAEHLNVLMTRWHNVAQTLLPDGGGSIALDFHTIPYHGDEALLQKHYVSKRSRRLRGILALVVREASHRTLIYGRAELTRQTQYEAVLDFIECWQKRAGQLPGELIFVSRFTTYAHLDQLTDREIYFLTLRRRTPSILEKLFQRSADHWKTVRLHNTGRTPRVLDDIITLRNYPHRIRQLAIQRWGQEKPTLLITNHLHERPGVLIDRYVGRMLIENAVNFFHMDALSSTVSLRIDLDLQLTFIASTLYRALAGRLPKAYSTAKFRTLFNHFVIAPATVIISADQITV